MNCGPRARASNLCGRDGHMLVFRVQSPRMQPPYYYAYDLRECFTLLRRDDSERASGSFQQQQQQQQQTNN